MQKYYDIFNSQEQIKRIDRWLARAEVVTSFFGSFLLALMTIYLIWQYLIR